MSEGVWNFLNKVSRRRDWEPLSVAYLPAKLLHVCLIQTAAGSARFCKSPLNSGEGKDAPNTELKIFLSEKFFQRKTKKSFQPTIFDKLASKNDWYFIFLDTIFFFDITELPQF